MGADIYLNSRYEANRAEWKPRFDAAVEARNAKYPNYAMPEDAPEQAAVTEAYDRMMSVGYFRDSYNSTSLFWLLDLSWWQGADGWSINSKGQMGVRSMRNLRAFLESPEGQITDERMATWARKAQGEATIEPEGQNSLAAWRAMFERKRERLIALLSEAIELKEPLSCSV